MTEYVTLLVSRFYVRETGDLNHTTSDTGSSRGTAPGELLAPVRKDGLILSGGITPAAVYGVMEKRRCEAGVEPFTPHDLRRTFAGDLLDAGADIVTVQKLMGHLAG